MRNYYRFSYTNLSVLDTQFNSQFYYELLGRDDDECEAKVTELLARLNTGQINPNRYVDQGHEIENRYLKFSKRNMFLFLNLMQQIMTSTVVQIFIDDADIYGTGDIWGVQSPRESWLHRHRE